MHGNPCRILGIRSLEDVIYGVDEHGRLFKFQNAKFTWLLDENHAVLRDLKPGFFNDLVVVKKMIYITDSFTYHPTFHPLQRFFSFENSGRILGYNLENGELKVVADGLYLPNGIELYHDNRSLLVSECSMFRVVRFDIESKTISPFIENTFGAVDNIRRSNDGGYWIGLSATRFTSSSLLDFLGRYPALRHILTNKALLPLLLLHDTVYGTGPALYKVDSKGATLHLLTDPHKLTKTISFSEIHEIGEQIFVGTPFSPHIFVFLNLK
ncbi:adipocyte plasma membrane-associated protein-like [Bolinopsis microptera]|uniref:adipocyte plasma membrane-associated protein-like n=1 Tax=Bolinopsis microptera TaxID=2820187 RepID=UPI0030797534